MNSARFDAFKVLLAVIAHGKSLTVAFIEARPSADHLNYAKAMANGVMRWNIQLDGILNQLLKAPLKPKDIDVLVLMKMGLFELIYMDTPEYAVIHETVELASAIKKIWAKKLINAILRNFLRQKDRLLSFKHEADFEFSHPLWFIEKLKKQHPHHWQSILQYNQKLPLISLRINLNKIAKADYLKELERLDIHYDRAEFLETAVVLTEESSIQKLPGYSQGHFSVQNISAQWAAELIDLKPNQRVLDACAAPGGKACHMLEKMNQQLDLTAIDFDSKRCEKITENLNRLSLQAKIICNDILAADRFLADQIFDRILLDAPCSASGVIRKHPDIKFHRTLNDIQKLASTQLKILCKLWPHLKSGGKLLYVTCSVFQEENQDVINQFMKKQADVEEIPVQLPMGIQQLHGIQILPDAIADGFYYCLLKKA